jgi:hypothetical protein
MTHNAASLYRFLTISTGIIYWYYTYLLKIDEEEYGGHGALLQEGLFASFTLFLVTILFYFKKERTNIDLVIDMSFSFLLLAAFVDSSIQFGSLLRSSFGAHTMRPLFTIQPEETHQDSVD